MNACGKPGNLNITGLRRSPNDWPHLGSACLSILVLAERSLTPWSLLVRYERIYQTQGARKEFRAIPENREIKKWKFSFFHQRHALLTSFDIFVVTCGVTNFLPKLFYILWKKLNFHFRVMPEFSDCRSHPFLLLSFTSECISSIPVFPSRRNFFQNNCVAQVKCRLIAVLFSRYLSDSPSEVNSCFFRKIGLYIW